MLLLLTNLFLGRTCFFLEQFYDSDYCWNRTWQSQGQKKTFFNGSTIYKNLCKTPYSCTHTWAYFKLSTGHLLATFASGSSRDDSMIETSTSITSAYTWQYSTLVLFFASPLELANSFELSSLLFATTDDYVALCHSIHTIVLHFTNTNYLRHLFLLTIQLL